MDRQGVTLEFRDGFFCGLTCMAQWLDHHSIDLRFERVSAADVSSIIKLFAENVDCFMEYGDHVEIDMTRSGKKQIKHFTLREEVHDGQADSKKL